MRRLLILFCLLTAARGWGYTQTGPTEYTTTGTPGDVQAAITAAPSSPWTVVIPPGVHSWPSSVSIPSTKAIVLQGSGCRQILGHSRSSVSLGTGPKSFQTPFVLGSKVDVAITPGKSLFIGFKGDDRSFMQGTVSNYNGQTLNMTITSFGQSPLAPAQGTKSAWFIRESSAATTIRVTYATAVQYQQALNVSENVSTNQVIRGIHWDFAELSANHQSTPFGSNGFVRVTATGGGKPTLIQYCSFTGQSRPSFDLAFFTTRGVISKCSADSGWYMGGGCGVSASFSPEFISVQPLNPSAASWTTPQTMGMNDTGAGTGSGEGGTSNLYIEDCMFGGIYRTLSDFAFNSKSVVRDCIVDNSAFGSHGYERPEPPADNKYGVRHWEFYRNQFLFDNMPGIVPGHNWFFFCRGGSGVICSNYVENIVSNDCTDKSEWVFHAYNIRSRQPCFLCTDYTPGFVPQQPGGGGVVGAYTRDPVYIWGNTGYGNGAVGTGNEQVASCGAAFVNCFTHLVFRAGNEYLVGLKRPSWEPYPYPHWLAAGGTPPEPPETPPTIDDQPDDVTVQAGAPASFSVSTTGASSWQWRTNGVNITGATGSSVTYNPTVLAHNGLDFDLVAANAFGSVTSTVATLTVTAPPSSPPAITAQPQSATRTEGQSVSFGVTATGDDPKVYQWQTNEVNVTGEMGTAYGISSVALAQNGWQFRVVITNAHGSITSSVATLTVNAAPVAAMRYVDESAGDDDNPGTSSLPWRHCPGMTNWTGQATLLSGDTVYFDRSDTWTLPAREFGPGLDIYPGVHYIGDEWDPESAGAGRAKLMAAGTNAAGVVRFWIGDHQTLPTWIEGFEIDGGGLGHNLVGINYPFSSGPMLGYYKRVEDCVIHSNVSNATNSNVYAYGLIASDNSTVDGYVAPVANVEFIGNVVTNVSREGIAIYPGQHGRVHQFYVAENEVWGTGRDPSYAEGSGIAIKGDTRDGLVEWNYVHDVAASAIFMGGPEFAVHNRGPSNVIVRLNILGVDTAESNDGVIRFFDADYPGTTNDVYAGCDVTFASNIILPEPNIGGFRMDGSRGTNMVIRLLNNTFYGARIEVGNPDMTAGHLSLTNNIVYTTSTTNIVDSGSDITAHARNLLHRVDGGMLVNVGGTAYNAGNVATWEPTVVASDPLFVNTNSLPTGFTGTYPELTPNTLGLSYTNSSPALTNAVTLADMFAASMDILRPVSQSGWSFGAHQQGAAMNPTGPPPAPTGGQPGITGPIVILVQP